MFRRLVHQLITQIPFYCGQEMALGDMSKARGDGNGVNGHLNHV